MTIYAITGTHSTGKSTLLERLKDIYEDFYFNESSTRKVTNKGERKLECITDDVQSRIYESILEKEAELTEIVKTQNIMMDRSFIDFTAYTTVFNQQGLISDVFCKKITDECRSRLNNGKYGILFYLPIEFKIVDDGIRSIDEDLQRDVDTIILGLIKEHSYVVRLTGTVDERVKQIKNHIG